MKWTWREDGPNRIVVSVDDWLPSQPKEFQVESTRNGVNVRCEILRRFVSWSNGRPVDCHEPTNRFRVDESGMTDSEALKWLSLRLGVEDAVRAFAHLRGLR